MRFNISAEVNDLCIDWCVGCIWRRFGVYINNLEHIQHYILRNDLLITLNMYLHVSMWTILLSEAVTHRYTVKKVFLKFLQNSQDNTCVRVSFLIKLQAFVKKETLAQVFSFEFCKISKFLRTHFLTKHLRWLLLSHDHCDINFEELGQWTNILK